MGSETIVFRTKVDLWLLVVLVIALGTCLWTTIQAFLALLEDRAALESADSELVRAPGAQR